MSATPATPHTPQTVVIDRPFLSVLPQTSAPAESKHSAARSTSSGTPSTGVLRQAISWLDPAAATPAAYGQVACSAAGPAAAASTATATAQSITATVPAAATLAALAAAGSAAAAAAPPAAAGDTVQQASAAIQPRILAAPMSFVAIDTPLHDR